MFEQKFNHDNENMQEDTCKIPQRTGFRNIVRRIQLAARFSNVNPADECYSEDTKLNLNNNVASWTIRRRSMRMLSTRKRSTHLGRDSINLITSEINEDLHNQQLKEQSYKKCIKGEIKFIKEGCKSELTPFISIEPDVVHTEIAHVFKNIWELEMPKIITFVITSKSHKCEWQNKKQIKHFQTGIAKAAISTNMWILTNGLSCGATAYISSAIENELKRNRLKRLSNIENFPLLFGISYESDLTYGNTLTDFNSQSIVCIENQGYTSGDKFELDPDHSHFIIVKNKHNDNAHNFSIDLIQMFAKGENFYQLCDKESKSSTEIPLVSILIEGEPQDINIVLELIKKQMPVVVLHGSGGLADILADAYFRIWDTFPDISSWDPDYIEEYVKPLLAKKIGAHYCNLKTNYLVCSILRDQVIECIRHSKQDGREYLIILDMYRPNSCNLQNLSEHLLNALLKARRNLRYSTHEQILKDLDLIVDWNCANVAKHLLFTQNSLNITEQFRSKFFNVLIRENREQFVDIFLCYGFQLHKFLTPSRLNRLFRIVHEDDFFQTVCWETALGQSSNAKQGKFFIESDLNWLIEFCTGLDNFVNTEDLHLNSLGFYTSDSLSAERKALTLLSIWAVMQNRYELAMVLWKYSDHPVHLALIISMFFERLSWSAMDANLKAEMKQKSKQFANYANGVLDRCYNENITQAYNVLRESIKDWNYMTAVDIAANAQSRQFMAHPCCQKWLTNTFHGKIRLREITWGFISIPTSIKILLCSLFVFPMYIWVRFKNDNLPTNLNIGKREIDDEFDVYENMYSHVECNKQDPNYDLTRHLPVHSISNTKFNNEVSTSSGVTNKAFEYTEKLRARYLPTNLNREVFVKKQPPVWKMIQMMWCSPITKFYTSQLFYMIFLVLLSLAALHPNCGNYQIDSIVCLWTILILIAHIRHTCILAIKYSSVSFYPKIIEIILIFTFASIFFITRILRIYFYPIYGQKVIISLALLYFYYRLISIYLPISPSLGPLLHRFRLMVTVDFVNYMRITLVIIISNAIVISALQYPYNQVTFDSISNVFHQGLLSLFYGPPTEITVKTDLDNKVSYCAMDGQTNFTVPHKNSTSQISEEHSFIMYIFVYQYYIILKLIVGPLLFSIFAVTASKWVTEIDGIWKFQRYHLVIDFVHRLPFPEPFSLFYYMHLSLYYLANLVAKQFNWNVSNWNVKKILPNRSQNIISPDDCLYWKELAAEYLDDERKKSEESQIRFKEWEYIQEISEEIEYEKKVLREIKGKIAELEKSFQSKIVEEGKSTPNSKKDKYLSRLSPYPGTQINRYPLPRKYVSWNIAFFSYEPVCHTKALEEFHSQDHMLIDEDILKLKEHSLRDKYSLIQMPSLKWNDIELDQNGILIDRRSWQPLDDSVHYDAQSNYENVSKAGPIFEYKLEDNLLPLNPYGRTGIRGKGANRRWGPNHHLILIVAQTLIDHNGNKQTKMLFELIENKLQLIERYVNNESEIYDFFTKLFHLEGMIRNLVELQQSLGIRCNGALVNLKLVQSGYWDDPHNTDNAWKEANLYLIQLHHSLTRLPLDNDCRFKWSKLTKHTMTNLSLVHAQAIDILSDFI